MDLILIIVWALFIKSGLDLLTVFVVYRSNRDFSGYGVFMEIFSPWVFTLSSLYLLIHHGVIK